MGYNILLFLVILGFIFLVKKIPEIRGHIEEKKVSAFLATLPSYEYKIFNDILLATESGTTQIDHIVVSRSGIFVIETKNYRGWITGNENGSEWTKNVYGNKYRFANPFRQNYGHIKALEKLLNIDSHNFISIVCFSSRASLKVQTTKHLIYDSQLINTIRLYQSELLSDSEVERIASVLSSSNIVEKRARKEHVTQLQKKRTTINQNIRAGICPQCGGNLVLRNGKYGSFYGCSHYPTGKFTNKI